MFKITKKSISVLLSLAMIFTLIGSSFSVSAEPTTPVIKNVIYMIPDGGAMAPFYLADAVKQAGGFDSELFPNATPVEAGEMYLKDYLVGAETTYSANAAVTDSAASGTALSSGYKTNNGYVGVDPNGKPHANILEACQDMGKKTGIVVTYEWTNATPAAFSAHDMSRNSTKILSEQIANQGIDVVLGNTLGEYSGYEWFNDAALNARGYDVIHRSSQLEDVEPGDRIWGKLPAAYWDYTTAAPNLAKLTKTALTALDNGNEEGFFLMVEGSAVDGGGHGKNAVQNVSEYLAFDEACKVAIEFAKERTDTIVVVAPDHDTGGLYYNYSNIDTIVNDIQSGINSSYVSWETDYHTARNGGVFMYLPDGVPYPTGIDPTKKDQVASEFYNAYGKFSASYPTNPVNVINNIDIVKYIESLIGADLEATTEKLFVDVTDQGTYDATTEIFTFTDKDLSIKRNSSIATYQDYPLDLEGEVAVYSNGKFYVPQRMLNNLDKFEAQNNILLYADYNTGTLQYSGNIGVPYTLVATVITKPGVQLSGSTTGDDLVSIAQKGSDKNGGYSFSAKVKKLSGSYTIYTNFKDSPNDPVSRSFTFRNTIPSMSVTSGDTVISSMSQLSAGDELDLSLSGFDLDDDFSGLIIIGQYDDGLMVDSKHVPVTGGSVEDSIDETITVADDIDSIKIFYWNVNTYGPLIGSYVIE